MNFKKAVYSPILGVDFDIVIYSPIKRVVDFERVASYVTSSFLISVGLDSSFGSGEVSGSD